MKHFVKTDVVTDILDLLKVCHCVLLTGVSGMGKTLTAQNIALHLCHEQKYSIVPCSNLNDIEMRYTDAYNQVFFIDDICGRFTTNRQKIEDWMRLDEFFKPILRKGMTKILATCRTEVFLEEIFQATFELFNKSSYNLSEKYSFKDKLVIAGKYLNQDEEMLAATLRNVDFTPLMCYLCAKHEHFDINDFLNSPYHTFCKEWKRLKYLDKEKYCVLFLCVLYNGKIDESIVDISKELDKDELRKLGDIFECCNLGRDTSRSAIKDKLNACIDTYFIKVNKEYTIIHDKMFDFLCCYFGKALITQILKFADDKLICERVQLESIKKPNSEFTIIISINDESKYIERLKKDVENGKIHWCLNNVQMRYKEYREKLLDLLNSLDYDLKKRLINIKDVTGINSYITSCLRGYEELVNFFVSVGANVDARNGWFTPLTAACRDGHLKTVEILLNKGSNINKTNVDGETPMYTACFGGHYALVELLIDRSADINKRNNTNHSSLYVSCLSGHDNIARLLINSGVNVFECSDSLIGATCGGSVKLVETLLTKEVDVNVVDMQGRTALLIACEEGYTNIVKLLIDKKADINKVDKIGSTPLHAACYAGINDIVQILINNLADVNMLDKYRETPLHKSCRKGYVNVIQTLLANGADKNKANRDGYTPGDLAETKGKLADINMLKFLETVPLGKLEGIHISNSHDGKFKKQSVEAEQYKWTPLYKACDRGDVETVKTLLLNRANVNMKTNNGELPLIAACQQGHGILIQMLLDKGADINQSLLTAIQRDYERTVNILLCKRGCFGDDVNTLMTLACKAGSIKTIRILLEKGADINHVDSNKNIPICIACTKGFFHIVELLIKRGSKLNYRCKDGKTPLYQACELGFQTIAEMLIVNGADVNEIYADRKALQHNNDLYKRLTEKVLVSNIPDKDGRYPLFLSIDRGFYLISEYLVQKDYHIAMLEDDRKTALISVFRSGKKDLSYLLVSKGYTTNLTNFNATMLYYACKLGLSEMVRTLHENKVDLKRVYKDGYTPFLLADIAGNDDLSAYLSEQCNYTFISDKTFEIVNSRYNRDKRYEYLFQACMNGHTEALINETVLSELNINIFFKPRELNDIIWFEQTPLCLAIRRGHKKVIELLLKYGANVNLTFEKKFVLRTDNLSPTIQYGYTPLFAAFQRKFDKITNILLDSGADLEETLYDACREGYIDAVQFLIKKGADVNSCVRYGQTALYAACIGGFDTIVKFLIERGANINQLGDIKSNSTCLHAACLAGNHKVVQLLVDSGASVDAVTNQFAFIQRV
ncbi:Hypothetical predicted protein [Mytilus galloprovincialis]|uniref:Novel STAND NTPase 3 domain-containing protein n=1 Tax=Mytilus galloprovincialis TaxID=29158 RepID=A0A8B6GQN4_MYTGA|nr:Hypothetical predicted protein [Mytilus galloprovincialis]